MLSKNERAWLARRRISGFFHICQYCPADIVGENVHECRKHCYRKGEKPLCNRLASFWGRKGNDEFEAMVAAKLAIMMYQLAANIMSRDFSCEKSCVAHIVCKKDKSCIYAFLKYARISVEEEMDGKTSI